MSDCGPECEETLRRIEAFLDGEVEPGLRAVIDKPLSGCSPCTQKADFRRHLKDVIASSCGQEALPSGFVQRILSRLEHTET